MTAADLFAEIATSPRLPDALCAGQSDLFDPTAPDDDDTDTAQRVAFAAKLCRRCPALTACRTWLDSLPLHERPSGVVAGRVNTVARGRPKATG